MAGIQFSSMSGFELTSEEPMALGKNLWVFDGKLKSPVSSFPVRMTVIKHGKALLLVSSFPPVPELLEQLKKLGQVKLILAPNAMHCLWGGAMRDACPGALLVGPPNAAKRHASLGWDATISSSEEFEAVLRKATGSKNDIRAWTTADAGNPWMQEILLLHKPSKTLVVTDLAFNFRPGGETPLPGGPVGVLMRNTYLRLAGGYRECCCTKPFGFLCSDPDAMCAVLDDIMKTDFNQVVVAHGDVVKAPRGKEAFGAGTVAFFHEVAERQRKKREAGYSRTALAAGAVAVAAAGAGVWRLARG